MSWYSDGEKPSKWDLYHGGDWDGDESVYETKREISTENCREHGYWSDCCGMDPKTGNTTWRGIECSVCTGHLKIQDHDVEYWMDLFHFCPFCGAIMDEECDEYSEYSFEVGV